MPWIADVGLQPRSGWTYKDPDTSVVVTSNGYVNLIAQAKKLRAINNLPYDKIEEMVNDYLCANNPPKFCQGVRGIGDVVYTVASPISRIIDRAFGTKLTGCSGCARRRAALNQALPL